MTIHIFVFAESGGNRSRKNKKEDKNGSQGPLEFPTAVVFVGNTAYISNFDTPRRDNLAADDNTSLDGIGASIAQITP